MKCSVIKIGAVVGCLISSYSLTMHPDSQKIVKLWEFGKIDEQYCTTPSSRHYSSSSNSYIGYSENGMPILYYSEKCLGGPCFVSKNQHKERSDFQINVKTGKWIEVSEDDNKSIPPCEIVPQYTISLKETTGDLQEIIIKDNSTGNTVEEAQHVFGHWRGKISKVYYFNQDLVAVIRVNRGSFGVGILLLELYALHPWRLIRTLRLDNSHEVIIDPQGEFLIAMLHMHEKTRFTIFRAALIGYEKLMPTIKGQDAHFLFV